MTTFLESFIKKTIYVKQSYKFQKTKSAKYIQVYYLLRAFYDPKQVF